MEASLSRASHSLTLGSLTHAVEPRSKRTAGAAAIAPASSAFLTEPSTSPRLLELMGILRRIVAGKRSPSTLFCGGKSSRYKTSASLQSLLRFSVLRSKITFRRFKKTEDEKQGNQTVLQLNNATYFGSRPSGGLKGSRKTGITFFQRPPLWNNRALWRCGR